MIVSADKNWGIGKNNELLFRTKGDMAYFRHLTIGGGVIMGRKTLDSLPGGRPLPDRDNIVLTRDKSFEREGVSVCHSLKELFKLISGADDKFFVIGGEQIYRQLMPYCKRAHITKWDAEADADAFIPDFDAVESWMLMDYSEPRSEDEISYKFCTYFNKKPQALK